MIPELFKRYFPFLEDEDDGQDPDFDPDYVPEEEEDLATVA